MFCLIFYMPIFCVFVISSFFRFFNLIKFFFLGAFLEVFLIQIHFFPYFRIFLLKIFYLYKILKKKNKRASPNKFKKKKKKNKFNLNNIKQIPSQSFMLFSFMFLLNIIVLRSSLNEVIWFPLKSNLLRFFTYLNRVSMLLSPVLAFFKFLN